MRERPKAKALGYLEAETRARRNRGVLSLRQAPGRDDDLFLRRGIMANEKFVGTPKKATTHVNQNEDLIFEKSSPGKKAYRLAELDVPTVDAASLLGATVRTDLGVMPELGGIGIIRHF